VKLSTKGRYGVRAMLDLAVYSVHEHVSLFNIAERQGISSVYLEQVFSTLRKAGFVKSIKGAQGGYVLASNPSKVVIGDILRALEGDLSIIDRNSEDNSLDTITSCIKEMVWDKIDNAVNRIVDSVTLEEIADDYKRLNGLVPVMYYI
jgi:Rrf2 family protein